MLLSQDRSIHYRLMFSENRAVMLLINPDDGRIIDASVGACQYYGYSLPDLTAMSIFDINTMSKDEIVVEIQRATEESKKYFNFRHRLASGEVRDVEVYSNPIPMEGQKFLYTIVHDITERKQVEERYRQLFERTGTGMALLETDGTLSLVNHTFAQFAEADESEIIGHSFLEWVAEVDKARMQEYHLKHLNGEDAPDNYEFQFKTLKGGKGWALINLSLFPDSGLTIASVINITDRKRTEEALKESTSKFRALVETTQDFIWEVTADGVYSYCSPQTKDILGYRPEELLGKTPFELMPPHEAARVAEIFIDYIGQKAPFKALENINLSKDGGEVVLETSGVPFFSINGELQGYRGVDRDITERKAAEAELLHLATHDSLTGLYNRNEIEKRMIDELHRASRYKQYLSIFMLDIDHFKQVNDDYGHQVGDIVLKSFARVLEESLRETDYAARYGGEEFVIILPETPLSEIKKLAGRLCKNIALHPIPIEGDNVLNITASIGVSAFPKHGDSLVSLLNAADSAMYAAKDGGRNCVRIANNTR